jgi:hypothetical protein
MHHSRRIADLRTFTKAPIFIARPVNRYLEDSDTPGHPARDLLISLFEVVEAAVKFIAVAASLDVIAAQSDGKAPIWLAKLAVENLSAPTLGKWFRLLRGLADAKASPSLPELTCAHAALASLTPSVAADQEPERTNLVNLRNAVAHGLGVPKALADELLALWAPRVEDAFKELMWLIDTEVWVRDQEGFRLLGGPDPNIPTSEPPSVIGSSLPLGGVAVRRKDKALLLHPLSRQAPVRVDGPAYTQVFVRQAPAGLLYTLFGSGGAPLQAVSGPDEVEALHRIFDFAAVRRVGNAQDYVEASYDEQILAEALQFVGREEARSTLFDAVADSTVTGIIFVKGPVGIGKSALLSRVTTDLHAAFKERGDRRASNERLLAYRFSASDRGCAPLPFLRWMIERLARLCGERVEPEPEHGLHDLRQMGLSLLAKAPFDRIVLVLDNLDEIARRHRKFILDTIPRLTSVKKLLMIIGTRSEAGLPEALTAAGGRSPFPDGLGDMSKIDIRMMLTELLPAITRPLVRRDLDDVGRSNVFIDAIADRADGLPLYVRLVIDSLMRGNMGLEQATTPDWLPPQVASFLHQLTSHGPLSDKTKLTPTIGCLLAIAREPLTADEIGAFLARALSPALAARMARERGMDPFEHRRRIANEVLSDLGSLLRSGVGADARQRYRLLHEQLVDHLLTSEESAETLIETRELLLAAARDPGGDEAAAYLYRNGIAHILEETTSLHQGATEAARLLTDFSYQLGRLKTLTVSGGDGGLREDWAIVVENADALDDTARIWRGFWLTDGAYFQNGDGRDAPREFLERALNYAPDTPIGQAAGAYVAGDDHRKRGANASTTGSPL